MAHSSAPATIVRYGNQICLFPTALAYQQTHTHIHSHVVTSTTEQHKQKALFDKSHHPKHSLYSPLAVAALNTHSNSLFLSSSPTCPVVSEALCEAYCGQRSGSAQIPSASYRKRRRRRIKGKQGTQRMAIWAWHKVSEVYLCVRLSKMKSHKQTNGGNKVSDDRDNMGQYHYMFTVMLIKSLQ